MPKSARRAAPKPGAGESLPRHPGKSGRRHHSQSRPLRLLRPPVVPRDAAQAARLPGAPLRFSCAPRRCWQPRAGPKRLGGGFPGAERSEPASAAPGRASSRLSALQSRWRWAPGAQTRPRWGAPRRSDERLAGSQSAPFARLPRPVKIKAAQTKESGAPGGGGKPEGQQSGVSLPQVRTESRGGEPATSRASRLAGFSFPAKGPRRDLNRFPALCLSLSLRRAPPGPVSCSA